MSEFKWRHFSGEIILQCVRWYCKYGISYRDLEEMMADLGEILPHLLVRLLDLAAGILMGF
jgi:transposase, IS6 family